MGVQENVLIMWEILPGIIEIVLTLLIGTSFFDGIGTLAMGNEHAVKIDVVASSMNIIQMGDDMEINMDWDNTPFLAAVREGAVLSLFFENNTVIAPYPLTIPIEGSISRGGINYFVGNRVSEFAFTNKGIPEVKTG